MGTPIKKKKLLLVFAQHALDSGNTQRSYGHIPGIPSFYTTYLYFYKLLLINGRLHLTLSMVIIHCRTCGNKTSKQ